MKASALLLGALSAALAIGLASSRATNRFALGPSSAFAQDDGNSDYEADQARQRDEDAEQQEQYQQQQEEQQHQDAEQQNEYEREQEEQRHQEEMDRSNEQGEEQQN